MIELTVSGMSCQHCARRVAQVLEGVPGALRAEVDLDSGRARVEGEADPAALVAAVVAAGYGAQVGAPSA